MPSENEQVIGRKYLVITEALNSFIFAKNLDQSGHVLDLLTAARCFWQPAELLNLFPEALHNTIVVAVAGIDVSRICQQDTNQCSTTTDTAAELTLT